MPYQLGLLFAFVFLNDFLPRSFLCLNGLADLVRDGLI